MSTQGFRLDPSLLKLSPAALLQKYEASTPEERVRLGFIRRATPQEFDRASQPKGAPEDFGGAVYTSSTPPIVSDDTDSGIPVTPMPTGVSFQKQNASGALHLDTSNPPAAELLQSGLRTVGTKMGQGQYSTADLSDSAPVGMGKFSAADLDEARPDFAKNPPGLPTSHIQMEEVSDPLGAIKSAPATILNAVTGQPGAVSTDELAGRPQTGDETVQGLKEVATPGKRLKGTNRLTRAAMNEASRFLGPAAAENPLMVGRVLAGGTVGQQTGQEAAEASGANPDQAEAAGNIGAVLGGTAGGFDYSRAPAPEPSPGATTPPQAPPEAPPSAAPVDPNPSPGAAPLQMTPATPKPMPAALGQQLNEALGGQALKPNVPLRNQMGLRSAVSKLPEGFTPIENSSALKGYKYDPATQEFDAITKDGQRFRHGEVSPEQFDAFQRADSAGKAWAELRKGPGVTPLGKVNAAGKVQPRIPSASASASPDAPPTPVAGAPAASSPAVPKAMPTGDDDLTSQLQASLDAVKKSDRRVDTATRQKVTEMSPDEMRKTLLTSDKVDLPNKRAFQESDSPFVGMSDADGLKAFNDEHGYSAGDALLTAKAKALREAGLDAYHDKGDEFLYRASSPEELKQGLEKARDIFTNSWFEHVLPDGTVKTFKGTDFSYGIGKQLGEAENGLKAAKAARKSAGTASERGDVRGIVTK